MVSSFWFPNRWFFFAFILVIIENLLVLVLKLKSCKKSNTYIKFYIVIIPWIVFTLLGACIKFPGTIIILILIYYMAFNTAILSIKQSFYNTIIFKLVLFVFLFVFFIIINGTYNTNYYSYMYQPILPLNHEIHSEYEPVNIFEPLEKELFYTSDGTPKKDEVFGTSNHININFEGSSVDFIYRPLEGNEIIVELLCLLEGYENMVIDLFNGKNIHYIHNKYNNDWYVEAYFPVFIAIDTKNFSCEIIGNPNNGFSSIVFSSINTEDKNMKDIISLFDKYVSDFSYNEFNEFLFDGNVENFKFSNDLVGDLKEVSKKLTRFNFTRDYFYNFDSDNAIFNIEGNLSFSSDISLRKDIFTPYNILNSATTIINANVIEDTTNYYRWFLNIIMVVLAIRLTHPIRGSESEEK